jgi:choline dehydrogenase
MIEFSSSSHHADILIIGGGGAGCILARRLAELLPEAQIRLLEAGGDGRSAPFTQSDVASVIQTWGPASSWQLNTVPQSGLGGRTVPLIQGKVLGGGTSVNAMMYVRGDLSVVDEWHGISGHHSAWSADRYQSTFRSLESCLGAEFDPSVRGMDGPIEIRSVPNPSFSARAFLDGCAQLGADVVDFNAGQQANTAGLMQLNLGQDGHRFSMVRAFLNDPLPSNLSVHCAAEVHDLLLDGDHVSSVRLKDGRAFTADHVVVSAGAFQTPSLLMASGIGDPERLAAASIPCQVANHRVGADLSDHMRTLIGYSSSVDPGITEFLCEAALFRRTGLLNGPDEPDFQINFSAGIDGFIGAEFLPSPPPPFSVIFVPILVRPRSRGSVYPLGPTLDHGFGIDPAYLTDPMDLQVYLKAIEAVRELAASPAMQPFCSQELCPGSMDDTSYLRDYAQTIWHPVGSCGMGSDPATSACSPDFRLRGTQNLYVADASVLPTLPSGNPQAAVFAMASIAAETVANDLNG